jgi:hypothetical protein
MQIEQAIELLKASGYRVTRPRKRANGHSTDGRPTTTKWPPNRERNERYVGPWPPKFQSGLTSIARLRAPYGPWMKLTGPCKS